MQTNSDLTNIEADNINADNINAKLLSSKIMNLIINSDINILFSHRLDDTANCIKMDGIINYNGVNEPYPANLGNFSYQFTDNSGTTHLKESSYDNLVIVDYFEKYDDVQERGEFCIITLDID